MKGKIGCIIDIAVTTVRESVVAKELCNSPSKEENQYLKKHT